MTHGAPRRRRDEEIEDWVRVVDRLPFVSSIKRDATALRRLLYDRRAPRIAIVGSPGCGRTTLANALLAAHAFGQDGAAPPPAPGQWVRIDADGRRLDWMELPAELPRHALIELAQPRFEETLPDVLVGAVEAGAEDAAAGPLRDALEALRGHLRDRHGHEPPVLVLLTKADALHPSDVPPPDKEEAIEAALGRVRSALTGLGLPKESLLAVVGLASETTRRWNVERVGEEILERLPDSAKLEGVRAFEVGKDARRRVARALVNSCSALAVTVGLAPIPFADAFLLLPLQAAMVTGIAYLSGRPWNRRAAAEWLASIGVTGGAGMGLRWGAQQLVKLVPGAGALVSAGVAGAGTLAIGRSAIAYFVDGPGSLERRPELRAG